MKKILNTLYITSSDAYLSLDGENVIVNIKQDVVGRVPLHTLDSIVTMGYFGASPALMGKCAADNRQIVFLKQNGAFLARTSGKQYGNILLRKEQFRVCESEERSLNVAKNIIAAKLYNSASVLRRALSDYSLRINTDRVQSAMNTIRELSKSAYYAQNAGALRGMEGEAANVYFGVFDELVLQQKEVFHFCGRNRRPSRDPINAMLSFGYSLMTSMCVSALETVGLDAYAGFFHTDRPGRCSLALDLVEEFRAPFVDRFVLSLINKKMIGEGSFVFKEDGAVIFTDEAKKSFLENWQNKKREEIEHPFLKEKTEWGMLPYVQALLLSRYLRGDIDAYPPFYWK